MNMKAIFTPVVKLMRLLKYPYKLGLVSVFFVMPIVALVAMLANETSASIDFARKEHEGIAYIQPLRKLLEHTQQHRGMANALLAGDASFAPKLEETEKKIAEIQAEAEAMDKRHVALGLTEKLKVLLSESQVIRDKVKNLTPKESFAVHTAYIATLMSLINDVADASNLTQDPDLDFYYVMDAVVVRLPAMTESLGQARALGVAVAARGAATAEDRAHLSGLHSTISTTLEGANRGIEVAMRANASLKTSIQGLTADNSAAVKTFLGTLANEFIRAEAILIPATQYFDAATVTIDGVYKLNDMLVPELDRMLTERIDRLAWKRTTMLALVAGVLLLVGYLYISFYLSVIQVVRSLVAASHDMAHGELDARAAASGRDELAHAVTSFN